MKKRIVCIFFAIIAALCLCLPVSADMGPKPSIELKLENPPDEVYYVDLLLSGRRNGNMKSDVSEAKEFVLKEYPGEVGVFSRICDHFDGEWRPRLGNGHSVEVFRCNDKHTYKFDYDNVPKNFKVIISTKSGEVMVSDECHVKAYNSTVTYDVSSGEILETSKAEAETKHYIEVALMFAATLLMTLLVEFVVVRRFKYPLSNRTNVLTVLLTNIVTQMFLYISIEFLGLHFLIAEAIILVVEAVVFAVLLKPRNIANGLWCAAAANIASFLAGVPFWFLWFLGNAFFRR